MEILNWVIVGVVAVAFFALFAWLSTKLGNGPLGRWILGPERVAARAAAAAALDPNPAEDADTMCEPGAPTMPETVNGADPGSESGAPTLPESVNGTAAAPGESVPAAGSLRS